MYPKLHYNREKKKINGKTYYHYLVIGNHGVSSTWLANSPKSLEKLK
ncbi:hypothetical protein KY332_00580 [Candidatus Woesearchaeota archaeon]|nr:hypothetical protein [Candidatus Woesearchaeota archaeon]